MKYKSFILSLQTENDRTLYFLQSYIFWKSLFQCSYVWWKVWSPKLPHISVISTEIWLWLYVYKSHLLFMEIMYNISVHLKEKMSFHFHTYYFLFIFLRLLSPSIQSIPPSANNCDICFSPCAKSSCIHHNFSFIDCISARFCD